MKILSANFPWIGGVAKYIEDAFEANGSEVERIHYREKMPFFYRQFKLNQIMYLNNLQKKKNIEAYNRIIVEKANAFNPDLFFVFNEGYVLTDTVKYLKKKGVFLLSVIGDDPFDSFRFLELPYSLGYFDKIFVGEKYWIPKIKLVAPNADVRKIESGYDPEYFNVNKVVQLSQISIDKINCKVAFTGESYGRRVEGGYRSSVLSNLVNYGLKIWGDEGWKYQFKFYPELRKAYSGGRLSYDELITLYGSNAINLNLSSPQVISAFQPRLLEIIACGGFVISENKEDSMEVFGDNLVTFDSVEELKEKVEYFITNPSERSRYVQACLKIVEKHSWTSKIKEILNHF